MIENARIVEGLIPVPTPEQMESWYPDPAPEKKRFNVSLGENGEVIRTELTLQEYRDRHVAKILNKNNYILQRNEKRLQENSSEIFIQPWIEPTEIVPIPTEEEMENWFPDLSLPKRRFHKEINVITKEITEIELTLQEYRDRHVAKAISRNKYLTDKWAAEKKAKRAALLEKLLDEMEAKETA